MWTAEREIEDGTFLTMVDSFKFLSEGGCVRLQSHILPYINSNSGKFRRLCGTPTTSTLSSMSTSGDASRAAHPPRRDCPIDT